MIQELCQEAGLSDRLHQLNLHTVRIAVLDEAKALVRDLHRPNKITTKDVVEHERRPFDFANSNRDVIESLRECQLRLTSKT
jgi:hypothetical protein